MRVDQRILVAALAVSLLANLFLAGVLAGRVFAVPVGGGNGLAPAARVRLLPADEQARYDAAMAPYRPAIRAAQRVHRAARQKIEADITASRYDRALIAADFAALRDAQQRQQVETDTALLEALGVLSPTSRAALVTRVRDLRARIAGTGVVGNGAVRR